MCRGRWYTFSPSQRCAFYSGFFFRSCSMDCQCDTCATLSSEWWLLVTRKVPSVLKQEIFSTTSGVVTDVVLVGRTCRCGDTSVDLQSEWRWWQTWSALQGSDSFWWQWVVSLLLPMLGLLTVLCNLSFHYHHHHHHHHHHNNNNNNDKNKDSGWCWQVWYFITALTAWES